MRIRPARPGDAGPIAHVNIAAWRSAYAGLLPEGLLAGLSIERSAERWRLTLERPPPRTGVLVAAERRTVVGFASYGPARDPDCDPAAVAELYSIYLARERWDTGLGRRLHDAAVAALDGYEEAILWVLDGNARARRFYERCGWNLDGAEKDEPRYRPARELRYRRRLYSNQTSEARIA